MKETAYKIQQGSGISGGLSLIRRHRQYVDHLREQRNVFPSYFSEWWWSISWQTLAHTWAYSFTELKPHRFFDKRFVRSWAFQCTFHVFSFAPGLVETQTRLNPWVKYPDKQEGQGLRVRSPRTYRIRGETAYVIGDSGPFTGVLSLN